MLSHFQEAHFRATAFPAWLPPGFSIGQCLLQTGVDIIFPFLFVPCFFLLPYCSKTSCTILIKIVVDLYLWPLTLGVICPHLLCLLDRGLSYIPLQMRCSTWKPHERMLKFVKGLFHISWDGVDFCPYILFLYCSLRLLNCPCSPGIKTKMAVVLMTWIYDCVENFGSVAFIHMHVLISGFGIRTILAFTNETGSCSLCSLGDSLKSMC